MKRFSSVLFILILASSSCKKFLDTKNPDNVTPENYFNTEAEINRALMGVYDPLGSADLYSERYYYNLNAATDELMPVFFVSRSTNTPLNNTHATSDPAVDGFWRTCYIGIQRANVLLENFEKANMPKEKRDCIEGETRFLRGYYYFLLASNFGDVPLITTATRSITNTDIARTPIKDVYNQVVDDMLKAESLLQNQKISSIGHSGRVTLSAVQSILARVYITMAGAPLKDISKYDSVLVYTSKVINSGEHSLNPSYSQIFTNLAQDKYDIRECIWEVEFKGPNINPNFEAGRVGVFLGLGVAVTGTPNVTQIGFNCSNKFLNTYQPGDIRKFWNCPPFTSSMTSAVNGVVSRVIATNGVNRQGWFNPPGKFRRELELIPATNVGNINWPIIRYSDVLLMHAEALNEVNGGPTADALEKINMVRRRAMPVSTGVIDNIVMTNFGSGYLANVVPNVTLENATGSGATFITFVSANRVFVYLTDPGRNYSGPVTINIGTKWAANTTYPGNTQLAAPNGRLYTLPAAGGTTNGTPPTHTTGSSTAAQTGVALTHAGFAATATANAVIPQIDLPAGMSKQDFFEAIKDERSRELCFEALRRPDLMRWGIYYDTMKEMVSYINDNTYVDPTQKPIFITPFLYMDKRHELLPIPQRELNLNNLLVQNTGW